MKEDNVAQKQSTKVVQGPESEHTGGKTMSPPPFQLMASNSATAQRAVAPPTQHAASGTSAQRKEDPKPYKVDKKVPDLEYGASQSGPIAVAGAGDKEAIAPKDIHQGALGDCWLLAALASIANTSPKLLSDAIKGPNKDGSYDVRLYKKKGGIFRKTTFEAETINVQPSFVSYKGTTDLAYANGGDKDAAGNEELWVKLIEKAYAKWKGSYKKLNGGWSENAFESLTGKSFGEHGLNKGFLGLSKKSEAEISKEITESLKAGSPMTASTKSDSEIAKADKGEKGFAVANRIVGGHAYAILKADENTITLRNPWGDGNDALGNPLVTEPVLTWAQFKKFYRGYTSQD